MQHNKKLFLCTALLLTVSLLLAACTVSPAPSAANTPASTAPISDQPAATGAAQPQSEVAKPDVLTYWAGLGSNSANMQSLDENLVWQEMQRIFDVDIEFIHSPGGQDVEQFNLMLASREFPDIVDSNWSAYNGGPEKAISDGVIIKLNDLIAAYAPALTAYMEQRPDITKQFMTDFGTLYVFPSLNKSPYNTTMGFFVRTDWLSELGMERPQTMAQIEQVLTAFKEQMGADAPLGISANNLTGSDVPSGAFGVGNNFYVEDGKVKFGPLEEGYRRYVETYTRFYADGLLDPDFVALDQKTNNSNLISGRTGMALDAVAGSMGTSIDAAAAEGKTLALGGMYSPVENEGDTPRFSARAWEYRGNNSAAITTANKYPEFSAQMLDYFYSDEGHLLKNFGVEGVTFNYVDGKPAYSDLIFKNPDGLTYRQAMGQYLRCDSPFVGFIDGAFHESSQQLPEQREASLMWAKYDDEAVKYKLPQLTPDQEEAAELAKIMVNINTFKSEMVIKMIMGQEPLENYDRFVDEIRKMDIERALSIQQAAYDRYLQR